MNAKRGLLRGFRSSPAVAAAFTTYAERKDQRTRTVRPAHNAAAAELWGYMMTTPSQQWLRRLRTLLPPFPPKYTGGGVYALVSPCTRKFYIGKTNNFHRRLGEHLSASSRNTTRSTAPVHRLMRGAGASGFVMLPLVYAHADDDTDALERILIRRLQPSLNVVHTSRCQRKRPRRQSRRGLALPPIRLPATFCDGTHLSHDFVHLLRLHNSTAPVHVTCTPGHWHLVNRRALLRDFGHSSVTIFSTSSTSTGTLRHLAPQLHSTRHVFFHTVADSSPHKLLALWKLALLLHPTHTDTQLSELHPRHLIKLHTIRPTPPTGLFAKDRIPPRIYAAATRRLRAHMRQRFGYDLTAINLQLPPSSFVPHRFLRRLILRAMRADDMPLALARHLASTTRIRYRRAAPLQLSARRIREHLVDMHAPPACSCMQLNLPRGPHGHVAFRASDPRNPAPSFAHSAKTRPEVSVATATRRLLAALGTTMRALSIRFAWPAGHAACFIPTHRELQRYQPQPQPGCLMLAALHADTARLKQMQLVPVPLDRNSKAFWLECPAQYADRIRCLFLADPQHYHHDPRTPISTLAAMKNAFAAAGLQHVAPYDTGALPIPYALPKNKAPHSKSRPLVPCHRSPVRKTLQSIGLVWMHIVRVIGRLPDHFNGTSTQELKSTLAAATQRLQHTPGHRRAFAFDVKNMFTELPHDAIAAAADQGLSIYTTICDTTAWDVHLRRRAVVPSTGCSATPPECTRVTLPLLLPALLFELRHTLITVGDQVLKQTRGAAMGGYMSPAMAMLVCIAAERCMHARLGPHVTQHIAGFRYVDDGVVVVCFEEPALYTAVKTAVYAAYPAGMICEETAEGRIIDILEHRIILDTTDIHLLFRPKNFTAHLQHLPPPRVTFFPSVVRTGRVYFRAWVMGMCARLRDNTSATLDGLLHAAGFLAIWLDASHLGYSIAHTRRAILAFHPGILEDDFYAGRDLFLRLLTAV